MTDRKPGHVHFETWIEAQIREAQERGEFDALPGKGKPIPGLDQPYDELWWIKQLLIREDLKYTPPALALRKKVEGIREALPHLEDEAAVRSMLEAVNAEIREANRKPLDGPPTSIGPFDVERTLARWRTQRAPAPPPVTPTSFAGPHDGSASAVPADERATSRSRLRDRLARRRRDR